MPKARGGVGAGLHDVPAPALATSGREIARECDDDQPEYGSGRSRPHEDVQRKQGYFHDSFLQ